MELNCLLIAKLLNPLQAAHYMLTAYPQHCDALALRCAAAAACCLPSDQEAARPSRRPCSVACPGRVRVLS
jgi:hypothetical protein